MPTKGVHPARSGEAERAERVRWKRVVQTVGIGGVAAQSGDLAAAFAVVMVLWNAQHDVRLIVRGRVRAGVQVSGSALAPRVRLYSDPELPDAEKLAWVVLGRDATAGGAEAAVLQQAALVLLGRRGQSATGNLASRVGLDEIGFKGAAPGEDANTAALTFGKRISKDLYLTYERTLSGTLGALYIFYDLSRNLTLRGQAGSNSAVDLIYTMKYD